MESKRVVESVHEFNAERANNWTKAFDGDRSNLLGLGFRVDVESGLGCRQQNLERIHALDVGSHRDKGDDSPTKAGCGGVRPVVAYHHSRPGMSGFVTDHRVEIDKSDFASTHQLSATVESHTSLVGSSAHSLNAAA